MLALRQATNITVSAAFSGCQRAVALASVRLAFLEAISEPRRWVAQEAEATARTAPWHDVRDQARSSNTSAALG